MPPARPRADDSRSETSSVVTNHKDRAMLSGITKSKKQSTAANTDAASVLKQAALNGALAATNAAESRVREQETPQTDWSSMPVSVLHTYRAAYKLPTPASFTQPHAELLYHSSDIAKRSPSQVLARRKSRDLKLHRKKLAKANGVSALNKSLKSKSLDKDHPGNPSSRDGRRKQSNGAPLPSLANGDSIAQSIEPTSPTIASASGRSDSAPSTLNMSNPEATIIGFQSPTLLATNIRKHFNAQPLHEHDTIARFTYVMRQQGYGHAMLPGATNSHAVGSTATAKLSSGSHAPIRVEGAHGDGSGWTMGSMGREVRMNDLGSGGAFRLRFRPQV